MIPNVFRRPWTRLLRDGRGNVSIIFAFSLIPAIGLVGMSVDFATSAKRKATLDAIADSASLAAVAPAIVAQNSQASVNAATAVFNTQVQNVSGIGPVTLNVNSNNSAQARTVTVSYQTTMTPLFGAFIGKKTVSLAGQSQASASPAIYADFYLLLDDSPSMGIGATASDISAMQAANNGCAFACHSPDARNPSKYPGYTLPSVPGTQLRIDALRSATGQLITTAINKQTVSNQYRIGLYTFANSVTTVSPLTTNLTQVQTLNNAIALPTTDVGTQIGDAVDWLNSNAVTAPSGTGTQSSPIKFVFLVTDGVEDQAFNFIPGSYDTLQSPTGTWNGTPYASYMHSSACSSLKSKGVTVSVLYLNYDPLSDVRYTNMVQPYASNIIPALQACASPNFFFQADSASDINNAMQLMFAQALAKTAHLTQ
jgi:Flp pilus assembly protein TadG